ncbi:IclR family transcriptional regulator [Variovorax terrae]|uniref:IclR family transcriptional regulator n=1 Tax=Variovorax terrae TaxID=2923278 RepID=A0A9X1VS74_9BURK|nr:IclR family transcriptional regulator [Variovorax terrae]MCJ0762358.1 IclR family transcriptional regulator [Variovorax terrae]
MPQRVFVRLSGSHLLCLCHGHDARETLKRSKVSSTVRKRKIMEKDRQFVEALARGLKILDCFQPERPLLTNGEISALTGLACSSVSRLTHTLIKVGYLDYDSIAGAYRLGFRVLPIHTAMIAGTDVKTLVMPHMKKLAEEAGVRVALAAYENSSLVVLQAVDGGRPLVSSLTPGASASLPRSALGRAYLASCSSREKNSIVDHLIEQGTWSRDVLQAELKEAESSYAQYGYCISLQVREAGVHAVAVPIYLRTLGRQLVLACAAPAERFKLDYIREVFGPLLLRHATDVERAFSGARAARSRGTAHDHKARRIAPAQQ